MRSSSADLCDGDGGCSGGAPGRQISVVVCRSLAVYVICVFVGGNGGGEHTERNPDGRGVELGAQFPWPPDWILFFSVEKRRPKAQRQGRGSEAAGVSKARIEGWQSSVLVFNGHPEKFFVSLE